MSDADTWNTPEHFVSDGREVLGGVIDCDPASNADAQRVVRARVFFTVDDDGLSRRWFGSVWLNFPYSAPKPWVAKLLEHVDAGDVTAALVLGNARPGSAWFRMLAARAWRCEPAKRLRFWRSDRASTGAKMDSVLFYIGNNSERFRAVFSRHGAVLPPSSSVALPGAQAGARFCDCGRSLAGRRADAETCSEACRCRRQRRMGMKR